MIKMHSDIQRRNGITKEALRLVREEGKVRQARKLMRAAKFLEEPPTAKQFASVWRSISKWGFRRRPWPWSVLCRTWAFEHMI